MRPQTPPPPPPQDNSYHGCPTGKTLTLNIALNECNLTNGAMYCYKGSHKNGTLPFQPVKSYLEGKDNQPGNRLNLPEEYSDKRENIIMAKGDALFLHGNCIHGSFPNTSKTQSRPMFQSTYISQGEEFLVGKNANRIEISLH